MQFIFLRLIQRVIKSYREMNERVACTREMRKTEFFKSVLEVPVKKYRVSLKKYNLQPAPSSRRQDRSQWPRGIRCGRSPAEIVVLNPAGGMDVCLL